MAKEKNKSPILVYILLVVMVVIFIIQQFFPANFGKEFRELCGDAAYINVVISEGENVEAFVTEDKAQITELVNYLDGIKLKYRTLADSMSANKSDLKKYTFGVVDSLGNITTFKVDDRGLVQMNARVYGLGRNKLAFMNACEEMFKNWEVGRTE